MTPPTGRLALSEVVDAFRHAGTVPAHLARLVRGLLPGVGPDPSKGVGSG